MISFSYKKGFLFLKKILPHVNFFFFFFSVLDLFLEVLVFFVFIFLRVVSLLGEILIMF
jgi:hypothetical protein